MRRLAILLLTAVTASACYQPYGGGSPYVRDREYRYGAGPLRARILQSGVGLGVDLSSPAYVAVFQINPGRGVGLYYPAYQPETQVFTEGFTSLPGHGTRFFDTYFTAMEPGSWASQPSFYLLVASRHPLRSITRFQRNEGVLRSVLGLSAYTSLNYQRVMDDLIETVVPPQSDDDWTTDVLAVWPNNGLNAYGPYYTWVVCNDGYTVRVPYDMVNWACWSHDRGPGGTRRIPNPQQPPAGGDSTVQHPTHRRPEPPSATPGGSTTDRGRWTVPARRTEPRGDSPKMTNDGGSTRSPSSREPEHQAAEHPRVERPQNDAPRSEPRSSSPPPAPRYDPPPSREPAPAPAPAPRVETSRRPADPPR